MKLGFCNITNSTVNNAYIRSSKYLHLHFAAIFEVVEVQNTDNLRRKFKLA